MPFLPLGLSEPLRYWRPQMFTVFWNGYIQKKPVFFLKKHFCFHTYILFTNILCNIRCKQRYRQVQSGFTCNWSGIKASALPQTPTCSSEGKDRSRYSIGVARIISTWNWVVIALSSSWYDKIELWNVLLCIYHIWWSGSLKHLVGLNTKEISQFTNRRSFIQP